MTLIACIDDRGGISFDSKRQSRDRVLCQRLLSRIEGHSLRTSPYSARLFGEEKGISVTEDFVFAPEDLYFWEDGPFPEEKPDRIILYHWNRRYPADRYFPAELLKDYRLVSREEFVGSSHKKITEEIYEVAV